MPPKGKAKTAQLHKLINDLCQIDGVSGDEGAVRDAIQQAIAPHCECRVDSLGNLLAFKKGDARPRQTILFSAHMDEVGFIITQADKTGLLRFAPVGGIDTRAVYGRPVRVGMGQIPGIVGGKAVHLLEEGEKEKPVPFDELYIDIGAIDEKTAAEAVKPGDRVAFMPDPQLMGGGTMLRHKALDDRAGCALLIQMIGSDLPFDCHFAFTVQEETGCVGGRTAAFHINPDIGVVVEATTAADIPGVPEGREVCRLGGGPVLSFMDRGTVYDRGLFAEALAVAARQGIPCQCKVGVYGGNESQAVQRAAAGARVLAVSLPCRYIHTAQNLLHTGDLEPTLALLTALLQEWGK